MVSHAGWKTAAITSHHLLDSNRKQRRRLCPILHELRTWKRGVDRKKAANERSYELLGAIRRRTSASDDISGKSSMTMTKKTAGLSILADGLAADVRSGERFIARERESSGRHTYTHAHTHARACVEQALRMSEIEG